MARHGSVAVEVRVLGRIEAVADGVALDLGGPRQQALLARLAVDRGATVSTHALIDAVWDGDPPAAAPRTFRTYVARLRRSLGAADGVDGDEVLLTEASGYRLDDRRAGLDAERFGDSVVVARGLLAEGDAAEAARLLSEALGTWGGVAYGPFADRPWAQPEALRLEELRIGAQELRVRALLDAGRTQEAAALAEGLAAEQPLRESTARLLVLVRYRGGRHADALEVVRGFRQRLADEAGLDPSPQLDQLAAMVLDRDPRLDRPLGGRRLRGYVLHDVIARTALGTVHRAEQPSIDREVAITVLPAERADDPDLIRAFETRAQKIAAVEHPHLVPLYDYWREPGAAYVVTRFPTGGTLAQRLGRADPLDAEELWRLVGQVGGALTAAHEHGLVHGALDADAVQLDGRGDCFLWAFPLEEPASHPSSDVSDFARLVRVAGETGHGAGAGGALGTTLLSPAAVAVLERAGSDTEDGIASVAQLVRALGEALGQASSIDAPHLPRPGAPGPNPYRGLAAFRETDAEVFFGRGELATTIRGRLARSSVVAVVGPSGSGKSSVVRAGVLPHLRTDGHYVTTMVPGSRPLAELGIALSRVAAVELPDVADQLASGADGLARLVRQVLPAPDGDLVLVVDQFEELFTLSAPDDRDVFLRALADVVDDPNSPCRAVVTLRADFLGRALVHPVAGRLLRDRSVMVSPMSSEELHEAVVGPAEVAGVAVEPALATAVAADATRAFGSLPMVQFALTEVYEAADDGVMTLESYHRLGGIEGVLAQRAEEVVLGLDEEDRDAARVLFNRLVVPNDDGPPTRRRAPLAELAAVPDRVLDAFGRARLLLFDQDEQTREPTVEVTHEALFRAWPRLVAWIEAGEDDLRLLGHLTTSATEWDAGGRDEAELYRGSRLDGALGFADEHAGELTDVERDFVDAGRRRRARETARERRRVRRLRQLTSGLAVGLVLALVAGGLAWSARQQEASIRADAQADALAFAASATVEEDLELAALLAAESYAASPDAESQQALLNVLNAEPRVRRVEVGPTEARCGHQPPNADLQVFTLVTDDGLFADVRRFDMGEVALVPLAQSALCAAVDPSGRWIVTVTESGVATVHDSATGDVLAERSGVVSRSAFDGFIEFHPMQPRGVLTTVDGEIAVVELPSLETVATTTVDQGTDVVAVRFGEVGDRISVATRDGRLGVARPGGPVAFSEPIESLVGEVVAEQAGLLIGVTAGGIVTTPISDPGAVTMVRAGGATLVARPAVSSDGTRLATTTDDGVEVFSLPSLEPLGPPIEIDTTFAKLTWSQDGRIFKSGPAGVVTLEPGRAVGVGEIVSDVSPIGFGVWPAPDASGANQAADPVSVWIDLETGAEVPIDESTEDDPFAELFATMPLVDGEWARLDLGRRVFERGDADTIRYSTPLPDDLPPNLARIWGLLRVDHGRAVVVVRELASPLPDGQVVATWVLAFDLSTGELATSLRREIDDGRLPEQARALPDGRIVLATNARTTQLLDSSGEVLASVETGASGEVLGVSPSGELIALAGFAEQIFIVDDQLARVGRLTGVASQARTLRFAGEDRLVTQHQDGSTNVWDVPDRRLLGRLLTTPSDATYGLETTPDGAAVVHATPTGIARIPLDPQEWLEAICELVDRSLEQDELDAVAPGRGLLNPCGASTRS